MHGPRARGGRLGGPNHYGERVGCPRLRVQHLPFAIGLTERNQRLACMDQAMKELQVPPALWQRLLLPLLPALWQLLLLLLLLLAVPLAVPVPVPVPVPVLAVLPLVLWRQQLSNVVQRSVAAQVEGWVAAVQAKG